MKIVTCIKQVPASSEVEIDPVTGNLIRDGSNTKMNPYDLYAIETALRIKQDHGAEITTISMGPMQAKAVLMESLWMGCDDAMLLSDRKLGGADVVATSYALSQGIEMVKPDLIICGKQTTDGDTAQVGPEIAAHLKIPHVAYVNKIIEVREDAIVVQANMDYAYDIIEMKYPCLITVDKGIYTPRLPSYKRLRELGDVDIKILTVNDLPDTDPNHYGLTGSPTQVERMFPPEKNTDKELWEGDNLASQMAKKLQELKVL